MCVLVVRSVPAVPGGVVVGGKGMKGLYWDNLPDRFLVDFGRFCTVSYHKRGKWNAYFYRKVGFREIYFFRIDIIWTKGI